MTRLFHSIIILYLVLSLLLPSRCTAKPYANPELSFSPFNIIIKSLSIIRPEIMINVDDFKSPSHPNTDDDFLHYLTLFPTIQQGQINGLNVMVLSKIHQWQLHLQNLSLIITHNSQAGNHTRWNLNGSYDLRYPGLKTSGSLSLELESDSGLGKFDGRGKLKIIGKSSKHHYLLDMPINMKGSLFLKPKIFLDNHLFITTVLQVLLPSATHPLWKVICNGEVKDLLPIIGMVHARTPSIAKILPKTGKFTYHLALTGKKAFFRPPYDAKFKLQAKKMQFESENSEVVLENTGFSLNAGLSVPQNGPGSLKMTTTLYGGPFLWNTYFWDLSNRTISAGIECLLPFQHGFPVLTACISFSGRVDAAPFWKGSLTGSWSTKKGIISFIGQPMNFSKTLAVLLPEFMDEKPQLLKELRSQGHYQLSATIKQEGNETAITTGKFLVNNLKLSSKGYGQIHNLEITAPLAGLAWNEKTDTLQISRQVSPLVLKFSSISSPYLRAKAQKISLRWNNESKKLFMPEEMRVDVLGCPLTISNFSLHHPLSGTKRQAMLKLKVDPASSNHHVPELPISAKIIELINEIHHHVHAELRLSVDQRRLETLGDVQFPLFSGQVKINNIQIRRLFSPSRVMGMNIEAKKLDLQKVTALIQAGSATGIIDLSLKNFEISYGQPSKFDLEIRSVKTAGVPRKISVEAIENLSLLSSGSNAGHGLLNVGINRFFSHYRYAKIGLYCRLRDDAFQLRGLIHQHGREYVVKRGFLTGVDVVNYNPDNQISFRDMQERISRIFNKQ